MDKIVTELKYLLETVHEFGFVPDFEFFRSKKNRIRLHKMRSNCFLDVSKGGLPIFPTTNQYGGLSLSVLKRSLTNAKRLYVLSGKREKYQKIIDKLKSYITSVEHRRLDSNSPTMYKASDAIQNLLLKSLNINKR